MKIKIDLLDEILEENLRLPDRYLDHVTSYGYGSALADVMATVEKEDLLSSLVVYLMNYGFAEAKKTPISKLLDFYKAVYVKKLPFAKAKAMYLTIQSAAAKYVGDNGFLFKEIVCAHVESCVKKAEKLKDPGLEMYVAGLEGVLDESIEQLNKLSLALEKVLDWSSVGALGRACKILAKLKEWGNLRVVDCVTSTNPPEQVTEPLKEAIREAIDWSRSITGVNVKTNPRCTVADLEKLKWPDDQLKVWTGIE